MYMEFWRTENMCVKKDKEEKEKKKITEISKILLAELVILFILTICAGIFFATWCVVSEQPSLAIKKMFADTHYLYIVMIFVFYAVCLVGCYIELKGYCKNFNLAYKDTTNEETQKTKMKHIYAQKYLEAQIDALGKRFEIIKYFSLMPIFLLGFELLKDGINILEVIGNNYKSLVLLLIIMYGIFIVFQVRYYRLLKTELAKVNFVLFKIEQEEQNTHTILLKE